METPYSSYEDTLAETKHLNKTVPTKPTTPVTPYVPPKHPSEEGYTMVRQGVWEKQMNGPSGPYKSTRYAGPAPTIPFIHNSRWCYVHKRMDVCWQNPKDLETRQPQQEQKLQPRLPFVSSDQKSCNQAISPLPDASRFVADVRGNLSEIDEGFGVVRQHTKQHTKDGNALREILDSDAQAREAEMEREDQADLITFMDYQKQCKHPLDKRRKNGIQRHPSGTGWLIGDICGDCDLIFDPIPNRTKVEPLN